MNNMSNCNHFCILVDPQNSFINGSLGSETAKKVVDEIVSYIQTHHGPIIVTMDTHDDDDYMNSLEGRRLPVKHCIFGTSGWEIEKNIKNAVYEHGNYIGYVRKPTFGSFELVNAIKQYEKQMKSFESKTLCVPKDTVPEFTIIGYDTDICVISNALILRAAFPNSIIRICEKCCAGTSEEAHKAALTVAKSCQIDVI